MLPPVSFVCCVGCWLLIFGIYLLVFIGWCCVLFDLLGSCRRLVLCFASIMFLGLALLGLYLIL